MTQSILITSPYVAGKLSTYQIQSMNTYFFFG